MYPIGLNFYFIGKSRIRKLRLQSIENQYVFISSENPYAYNLQKIVKVFSFCV